MKDAKAALKNVNADNKKEYGLLVFGATFRVTGAGRKDNSAKGTELG